MVIAWFSCGVTSAVACKIALSLYEDVNSTTSKLVPVILITPDFFPIAKDGTINLSTLSEATSTPVCLMCCERGISTARMALPVLLN